MIVSIVQFKTKGQHTTLKLVNKNSRKMWVGGVSKAEEVHI